MCTLTLLYSFDGGVFFPLASFPCTSGSGLAARLTHPRGIGGVCGKTLGSAGIWQRDIREDPGINTPRLVLCRIPSFPAIDHRSRICCPWPGTSGTLKAGDLQALNWRGRLSKHGYACLQRLEQQLSESQRQREVVREGRETFATASMHSTIPTGRRLHGCVLLTKLDVNSPEPTGCLGE